MTESVHQEVLRSGGDIIGGAFPRSEPGRRPRPLPDRPQVTADIIEHRRDLLFGKLLDQSEQLFPLHAHNPSVRSKLQHAWPCAVSGTYPIVTVSELADEKEWRDTKSVLAGERPPGH
jgi:hypothetical protein